MHLNPEHLVLLALLAGPLHWIIARSAIAKPFWSRATGYADKLLRCAGCSGFWLGLGLSALGVRPVGGPAVVEYLAAAVLGALVTPVIEGVLLWGNAVSTVEEAEPPRADPE